METLLDHHLAIFDTLLHAHFMPLNYPGSRPHYCLAVITLLDQLNLKHFDWRLVSVILQRQLVPFVLLSGLLDPFDRKSLNIEFTRIVSKFLMDQDRAGSLWVNSHKYADLASYILEILRDK
jgi:hypothetical protein